MGSQSAIRIRNPHPQSASAIRIRNPHPQSASATRKVYHAISTHDCLQQVCNVKLERNSKNIYTQKNAEHVNEFCRCCNASLKVTYGDTWKSVSIVNLLMPTVGQNSFEVLLQSIGIVCERGPGWSERYAGHA